MIFWPGCAAKQRRTANSAEMVLPLPVGAPSSTFSSVWYIVWNICRSHHRHKLAKQTVMQCRLCLLLRPPCTATFRLFTPTCV